MRQILPHDALTGGGGVCDAGGVVALSLEQLEADYAEVRAAISACITAGQKYTLPGGRGTERVSLQVLERREARLRRQINQLGGSAPAGIVGINTAGSPASGSVGGGATP